MRPSLHVALAFLSASLASADNSYPNLLPSLSPAPSSAHDAPASTQSPVPAYNAAVPAPRKAEWNDEWPEKGVVKSLLPSLSSVGSVVWDKVGGAAKTASLVGAEVGEPTPRGERRGADEVVGAGGEEGYYRTIRETVEWVKPTAPLQPKPAATNHFGAPQLAPSFPTPTPEPAHISHLTPHLLSIASLLTFFIRHPYRFLRAYLLPYSYSALAFLATRLLWPILRLPLSLLWTIATTLFGIFTWPVRWVLGVWDRWGELGVFFGAAVAVGGGMGVAGAVASGPRVRRVLGGLVGRGERKVEGRAEARWERVPRHKSRRESERVGRGVGAYPSASGKVLRRSDSLDTIRPSAPHKKTPPTSAYSSATSLSTTAARPTVPSLRIDDSWASSAWSGTSPLSQGTASNLSTASFASASASSSEMGRQSSAESNGRGVGAGGGGRAGPARNAASVALAEARRRVEEIRLAKERERGRGVGVR